MTHELQLGALRERLAQLNACIEQLTAARNASTSAQQRAILDAQISSAEASRDAVQLAINNLDTDPVGDLDFAAAKLFRALHAEHVAFAKKSALLARKAADEAIRLIDLKRRAVRRLETAAAPRRAARKAAGAG